MPFVLLAGFGPDLQQMPPNFQMSAFLKLHMDVFGSTLNEAKNSIERIGAHEGLFRFEVDDNAKADFFVHQARKMGVSCHSIPEIEKVSKEINNNEDWHRIRLRLAEFPPHFHPEKTIELLDACRASRSLRQLLPYISLGRLGLWRYDAYERGQADEFVCLYFHQDQYTVSSYDNTEKRYFGSPQTAIDFIEHNLDTENPFTNSTSVEV